MALQRAAGWCECGIAGFYRMDLWGWLETFFGSRRQREPCPLSAGCAWWCV